MLLISMWQKGLLSNPDSPKGPDTDEEKYSIIIGDGEASSTFEQLVVIENEIEPPIILVDVHSLEYE